MLCHVTRPDSVVMEVEVDAKGNGEDCLNKVKVGDNVVLLLLSVNYVPVLLSRLSHGES